jgi:hypothetical protein
MGPPRPINRQGLAILHLIRNSAIQHDFVRAGSEWKDLRDLMLPAGDLCPHAFPKVQNLFTQISRFGLARCWLSFPTVSTSR